MTTICYKGGFLAADSGVYQNSIFVGTLRKIAEIGDNLVAASGNTENCKAFQDWVAEGKPEDKKPKIDDNFEGVIVEPNGINTWYNKELHGFHFTEGGQMFTMGSGWEIALGAMAAGASAEEACKIACRYDACSSEPVEVFSIVGGVRQAAE